MIPEQIKTWAIAYIEWIDVSSKDINTEHAWNGTKYDNTLENSSRQVSFCLCNALVDHLLGISISYGQTNRNDWVISRFCPSAPRHDHLVREIGANGTWGKIEHRVFGKKHDRRGLIFTSAWFLSSVSSASYIEIKLATDHILLKQLMSKRE